MSHGGIADFDARVAQVEAVAAAVAKFENPELQVAAFNYLLGERATPPEVEELKLDHELLTEPTHDKTQKSADGAAGNGGNGASTARKRGGSKASTAKKQTLTFDKSLDFYSTSGELGKTLKDFIEGHPAGNVIQKAVVVVYWLSKELAVPEITVDHVYSAFKTLEWPIPSNLLNTLQQAGSKNFLDTKKSTDVKMTTHGENLVEFELLPKTDS